MGYIIKKYIIIMLLILLFLPDWGFLFLGNSRPIISFPEIGAMTLILIWISQKLLQKNLKVYDSSLKLFLLIMTIIIIATIGAIFYFDRINWFEHWKSAIKLFFWAIFMFCWTDYVKDISSTSFLNDIFNIYINIALFVSIIVIFQYVFYQFTGISLKLNPFHAQGWGSMAGNYRAQGIYGEPSWVGVMLIPPLIVQIKLFLTFNRFSNMWKSLIILSAIILSFSLASYLVVVFYIALILLKWFYKNIFSKFIYNKIKKKTIFTGFVILCIFIISILVFFYKVYPFIGERIAKEAYYIINQPENVSNKSVSGLSRFSGNLAFWLVLKRSPLFGIGFDQFEYLSSLTGEYYEIGNGIIGFIGTSAGILGIIITLYIFIFIWSGGQKMRGNLNDCESELVVSGKAMVIALFLEQIILYPGILNSDFWLPLAFAYLFIVSGYKNKIQQIY